ncbi:hypothetical protein PO124_28655 [Bacillus licheniformis]|nr:hypothetical protein [Bacillus licheniformis]
MECSERSVYFLADLFQQFTSEEVATFGGCCKALPFDGEEHDGLRRMQTFSLAWGIR